jgi:EAL domain-containing protein (putative c-di-GMP-specific phosphodiesterase class I)
MEMLLVAEGVEKTVERDILCDLECDFFQGFLFAHPTPAFRRPAF